ncbi:hypothetical protein PN36_20960 [Candidatus Thiomargarita nelsonii]|uniref:Uncharacterized protein n=1 Tax=Candidatus Thiomargarita nelsonii TaxID=1003181 RepID=A0A0A6RW87_9GAMM|nr:hypothetical protein PN36_20960 [Candidatus Thiomargarita nelsonii]
MKLQTAYIVAAKRTAVGKIHGVFNQTRPDDLLVHAIKGLLNTVPKIWYGEHVYWHWYGRSEYH